MKITDNLRRYRSDLRWPLVILLLVALAHIATMLSRAKDVAASSQAAQLLKQPKIFWIASAGAAGRVIALQMIDGQESVRVIGLPQLDYVQRIWLIENKIYAYCVKTFASEQPTGVYVWDIENASVELVLDADVVGGIVGPGCSHKIWIVLPSRDGISIFNTVDHTIRLLDVPKPRAHSRICLVNSLIVYIDLEGNCWSVANWEENAPDLVKLASLPDRSAVLVSKMAGSVLANGNEGYLAVNVDGKDKDTASLVIGKLHAHRLDICGSVEANEIECLVNNWEVPSLTSLHAVDDLRVIAKFPKVEAWDIVSVSATLFDRIVRQQ